MTILVAIIVVLVVIGLTGATLVTTRRRNLGSRPSSVVTETTPSTAPAPKPLAKPPARERELPDTGVDAVDSSTDVIEEDAVLDDHDVVEVVEVGDEVLEPVDLAPPALRDRLEKTRARFSQSIGRLRGKGRFDESSFDELEEALILADVGVKTTTALLSSLREKVRSGAIEGQADAIIAGLEEEILELFAGEDRSLHFGERSPSVWLFVGVNGVGKTTTIGKVALSEIDNGHRVVLAAGDTFRAAAADQLQMWAERSGSSIVRGSDGADPSSVVFDAVGHAAARGADLVLADSAGRLHTKVNLMEELKKIRRIADRPPGELTEVLLVLDATTGQNGLVQAREFAEAVGLTGVVLTKLDGSAKGGIVLAIRAELGVPIKLVGVGEKVSDLLPFDPKEFANALLN